MRADYRFAIISTVIRNGWDLNISGLVNTAGLDSRHIVGASLLCMEILCLICLPFFLFSQKEVTLFFFLYSAITVDRTVVFSNYSCTISLMCSSLTANSKPKQSCLSKIYSIVKQQAKLVLSLQVFL